MNQQINNISSTEEIKNYYLDQNENGLNGTHIIKNYYHIQHSTDFPNDEFEKNILEYYNHLCENDFDDTKEKNFEKIKDKYNSNIEWLSILNTKNIIDHISTTCKMRISSRSELETEYSLFTVKNGGNTESGIEIMEGSKAIFKNCYFNNADISALLIDDNSEAIFEHCIFENNGVSCFINEGSKAKFINCIFKNDKKMSIFINNNSYCKIINCKFYDLEAKAIFAKNFSQVYIKDTNFINCQKGAATVCNKSKLMIDGGVLIKNTENTALRAVNDSEIYVNGIVIENTNGNGINIDMSTGYLFNCDIKKTVFPTIVVMGNKSNPIFNNCTLMENMNTFCVLCKNGCSPIFNNCKFEDCSTNCFSISDFSRPHIQNCFFKNIKKYYINIYGCSHVTFNNIESGDGIDTKNKINIFKSSKCEYKLIDEIDIEQSNDDDCNSNDESIKYETLTSMEEPEIIKSGTLKYLKTLNLTDIINETKNQDGSLMCSHCNKDLNHGNTYKLNCGHLICNDCKNIGRCSICDRYVEKIQKIFQEDQCAICLDHKPNTISLECGHMCMCYECSLKNTLNGFNCPLCNKSNEYKFIADDCS